MNKKLAISIPILIAIIVSVVVTTIMINNKESDKDPNLSPETNQSIDNEEMTMDKVYININNKKPVFIISHFPLSCKFLYIFLLSGKDEGNLLNNCTISKLSSI